MRHLCCNRTVKVSWEVHDAVRTELHQHELLVSLIMKEEGEGRMRFRTARWGAGIRLWFGLPLVLSVMLAVMAYGARPVHAAEELSLEGAVRRALLHATSLDIARFAVEEAEIAMEEALIGRLAGQPESEIRAAAAALDEARQAYIDQLVSIALEVEEAYYGVIRTEEMLQIQLGNREQADRQFAVAQARYEAGLISRQELLQAEMVHQQSVVSYQRTERQLADARRRLARLIGADEGAQFVLEDTFPFEPFDIELDQAIAEALAQRTEIKRAERTLAQAQLRVEQANNAYTAPVVLKKEQMAERRAEIQLEQARTQVIESVRQGYWTLKDAEYNVGAARQKESVAMDSLAIVQARFEAGMISLITLLSEQASALQAKLDAAGAVWDYNLAKARFLRTLGRPELPSLPDEVAAYIASWEVVTD